MKRRISVVWVVAVVLSVVVGGCKNETSEQTEEAEGARKAPEFTLTSFDGKEVSLSDYKGKVVVLEWLNTGCPFVLHHYENAKTMVNLAEKYKDVVWLAINSTNSTDAKTNLDFASKHKIACPILDDRDGKVGRAYVAKTTPHMFVIDTDGNIVYDGAIDNAPMDRVEGEKINYVDDALAALSTGKAVSIESTKPYGCNVKYAN
jgi:peroxiredoxin